MRCELLISEDMVLRGQKMLRAMIDAASEAKVDLAVTWRWERKAPILMTYGLGHPVRREWTEAHKKEGGRLVGWDLGYWNREVPHAFSMRVTIDDDHPHRWISEEPAGRFDRAGIKLRQDADPNGPIILVGLGRKQRALMRMDGIAWEQKTLERLRKDYPDREIVYRPKRNEVIAGLRTIQPESVPIEKALRGASLVVCHHSNVAVDACIAGIPVQCEDGAAFALYRGNENPTPAQRLSFLRSLAWWQWNPLEAVDAWRFLQGKLCA